MIYCKIEHPDALSTFERELIDKAAAYDHTGLRVEDVLDLATKRHVCIWRVLTNDGPRGILTTAVYEIKDGAELYVWHLAGTKGFLDHHDEILEVIKDYARRAGCQHIRCLVRPDLMERLQAKGWDTRHVSMMRSVR